MASKKTKDNWRGNPLLKKVGVEYSFSSDQVLEMEKCGADIHYFISNYVKIVNVDQGLITFKPYKYQTEIINLAITERFVMCKMPRQCGKTTAIVGIMLWYILFNKNYKIALLAHKMSQSREILSRIKTAYENLPLWLQQGVIDWNKGAIELENKSKLLASATTSSAVRGDTFNMIYLDEFAFIPNNLQEKFFSSTYPAISSGKSTKILITSTPNGLNLFWKMWSDSEKGKNDYKRVDIHWSDTPGRDLAWKLQTIRATSEEQFRTEFECEFIGSSGTLINGTILKRLVSVRPLETTDDIKIYAYPIPGHVYAIVVDTSDGGGGDYSAFVVFDMTTTPYQIVATYRNNRISQMLYPNVLFSAGKHFNNAYILVEINNGQQVANILHHDLEYDNVLTTTNDAKMGGQYTTAGFGVSTKFGVRTDKRVKRIGCVNIKTLVEHQKLIVNDEQVIYEMMRFVQVGTSFEAEEGHDDLMMCCVLFAWMINQPYIKDLTNIDVRRNLYDEQAARMFDDLVPFGFIDENRGDEEIIFSTGKSDAWLL